MSLHVRLFTNFWTHRKTAKLRSIIGNDAFWLPPRLWCYAAENQPDGDFSSYSPEELGMLLGYSGNAQAMLQALQQACFMVGMKINDWETHNGYHHEYSERAKNAARARWDKEKGKDMKGKDKKGDKHCLEQCSSIEQGFKSSLNALFHRKETTGWSDKELATLKLLSKRESFPGELEEMVSYYKRKGATQEAKYLRHDLATLLNNWTTELDRARAYSPGFKLRTLIEPTGCFAEPAQEQPK